MDEIMKDRLIDLLAEVGNLQDVALRSVPGDGVHRAVRRVRDAARVLMTNEIGNPAQIAVDDYYNAMVDQLADLSALLNAGETDIDRLRAICFSAGGAVNKINSYLQARRVVEAVG